eukprot:5446970-Alexandrium_andersonii.AAC.1
MHELIGFKSSTCLFAQAQSRSAARRAASAREWPESLRAAHATKELTGFKSSACDLAQAQCRNAAHRTLQRPEHLD